MHPLISRARVLAAAVAFATAGSASTTVAKTFVVDNISDPSVGLCDTAGACTLRQAILEAVALPGRDVITFDPTVFPVGSPGRILLQTALPTIADPAGTVIDGTGAGVDIASDIPPTGDDTTASDGLVFASATDVPLRDAGLVNVTVSGFERSGVVICGGEYPACTGDVVAPVVRRVTARWNGSMGISIQGQSVSKARIEESVAADNESIGFLVNGFRSIAGTRITRSVARGNDFIGILVGALTESVTDLAITDTSATEGEGAIAINSFDVIAKVALTNVAVSGAKDTGITVYGSALASISATNVVSSDNPGSGMYVHGDAINGIAVKDVVTNANKYGFQIDADEVVGAKITQMTAAGNAVNGIMLRELKGAKIGNVVAVGNGVQGVILRGTGNTVKQVRVVENIGDGLRLPGPGGGNKISGVAGNANQGAGIYVDTGNLGNSIKKNVALASDSIDLYDANPGCGTNVWKGNVFGLRNDPCIR